MADALRLQVIFGAIDKLTAPIRRIQQGTRGLSKDVSATRVALAGLKKAEAQIGSYRGAETRLGKMAETLDQAKAKTEALRREIAAVGAPTKRMAAALANAERAEQKATDSHAEQAEKVKALATRLRDAGVAVDDLAGHEARLGREIGDTSRQLERQQQHADRLERHRARGERLKEVGGRVALAGAGMTAAVTLPFVAEMKAAVGAAKESAAATAQVQAALKSMGNGAGFTVAQLSEMSGQLQQLSLFDDDDIMTKVTANLLTFGAVSGRVFSDAQRMAVDMSARLGQDLQSSTIQLGKALNDPVKGITALQRVGVAFTAAQKDQIKAMVAAGDTAGAQRLILAELGREFGGAAAAARAASPDGQMQQNWRTFQETVGAVALKVLPPLILNLSRLLERFNALSPDTQAFLVGAVAIAAVIGPVLGAIGAMVTLVGGVMTVLSVGALPAIAVILALVAAVGVFAYMGVQVYRNWGNVVAWWSGAWDMVKNKFWGFVGWFRSLVPSWGQVGRLMLMGLLAGLSPLLLVQHVMKLGSLAIAGIKKVLGIHSPSRVFAAIGGHMMGGLALGLDQAARRPIDRLHTAGVGMTRAMAGTALAIAAPSAAAPRVPGPGTAAAAPGAIGEVHIHIHPLPGQDPQAIARAVRAELAAVQRSHARAAGSEYRDDA